MSILSLGVDENTESPGHVRRLLLVISWVGKLVEWNELAGSLY